MFITNVLKDVRLEQSQSENSLGSPLSDISRFISSTGTLVKKLSSQEIR